MSDLLSIYLTRLDQRLSKKLNVTDTAELLREVSGHLQESVETLRTEKHHDPELLALKRIGPDRLLAENLIRAKKGLDAKPTWRFLILPTVVLFVYGFLLMPLMRLPQLPSAFVMKLLGYMPFLLLGTLAITVIRSRRLMLIPVLGLFGVYLATIVGISSIVGPGGITPGSAESRREIVGRLDKGITELESQVAGGKIVIEGGAITAGLRKGNSYFAPTTGGYQTVQSVQPSGVVSSSEPNLIPMMVEVSSEAEAKSLWRRNGRNFISHAGIWAEEMRESRNVWASIRPGFGTFFAGVWNVISSCVPEISKIVAVNVLVFLMLKLRNNWYQRTWRPERLAKG